MKACTASATAAAEDVGCALRRHKPPLSTTKMLQTDTGYTENGSDRSGQALTTTDSSDSLPPPRRPGGAASGVSEDSSCAGRMCSDTAQLRCNPEPRGLPPVIPYLASPKHPSADPLGRRQSVTNLGPGLWINKVVEEEMRQAHLVPTPCTLVEGRPTLSRI